MKKILLAFCSLLTAHLAFTQNGNIPYLEIPTTNSIWVNWKTDAGNESLVEYGTAENALTSSKTGTVQSMTDVGYTGGYFYHSVQLTGLSPATKYFYKVKTGNYTSAVYSFKTLPDPKNVTAGGNKMRFLIVGDNQLKDEPRYDSMLVRAKRLVEKKYNQPFNEAITSIVMVGDQVDVGTLDHYENVHFDKCKYLSPWAGISTIIGNHETYGTLKLDAYKNHFHYDNFAYKGISTGTEEYYAYQAGQVLFLNFTTEQNSNVNATQLTWTSRVLDSANVDPTVKWIVSLGHRPFQAEQYIGDISTWVRNTAYPKLITSPKMFLHVGAHHHLYARGQDKNKPVYNIISGGTAWDQYWGMSTEQDFDDVQKTISNWAYQIVEVDQLNDSISVDCYSVGYTTRINDWGNKPDKYVWEESRLIDRFYRKNNVAAPSKPTITNVFTDSLALPITINSSAYATTTGLPYNSTQFQISQSANFSTIEQDVLRDYENLFGMDGQAWVTKDINAGKNIFAYNIVKNSIANGTHYVRVRHRDRNMSWSAWSETASVKVKGSVTSSPKIESDKLQYKPNETITVTYSAGPGNAKDWVGIYKKGQTPGGIASTTWKYVNSGSLVSGTLTFTLATAGEYYITFLENDGYTELAPRINLYIGAIAEISASKQQYSLSDTIKIDFANAPANSKDWIGFYKIGQTPGQGGVSSTDWDYTGAKANGTMKFTNLPKGYYFVNYFLNDGYGTNGNTIYVSVGDTIASISIDKPEYNLGDLISVTFNDGPGIAKDYLGIFKKNDIPNIDPLVSYKYVAGQPNGSAEFSGNDLPKTSGDFFVVFFTNDSYNEISNRAYFKIKSNVTAIDEHAGNDYVNVYPNPTKDGQMSVVECNYPIDQIDVYDQAGRMIYTKSSQSSNKMTLVNHHLPPGIYTVHIHTNKLIRVKLVVNE